MQPARARLNRPAASAKGARMPSALRDASNMGGPKKGRSRSPAKRQPKPAASAPRVVAAAAPGAAATAAPAAGTAAAKPAATKPTPDGAKVGAALIAAMAPQHREVSRVLYRDFCQQVRFGSSVQLVSTHIQQQLDFWGYP